MKKLFKYIGYAILSGLALISLYLANLFFMKPYSLDHYLTKELVVGLLDSSSADGYVRKWQPYTGSIEKHIGYAIQWFLMALVLGIIGVRIALKQRKK